MAYQCPRCNHKVRRGTSRGATMIGGLAGGLIGGVGAAVISYTLGAMHCELCGPIPKKEFPREVRTEMLMGSLAIFSVTAVTLVGAVFFLYQLGH
jgi:hypothetical protein